MKALWLAVAVLSLSGCIVRPWNTEESYRIDAVLARADDPADLAAVDGLPAPGEGSTVATQTAALKSESLGKRKRKSSSAGSGKPKGSSKSPFVFELPKVMAASASR